MRPTILSCHDTIEYGTVLSHSHALFCFHSPKFGFSSWFFCLNRWVRHDTIVHHNIIIVHTIVYAKESSQDRTNVENNQTCWWFLFCDCSKIRVQVHYSFGSHRNEETNDQNHFAQIENSHFSIVPVEPLSSQKSMSVYSFASNERVIEKQDSKNKSPLYNHTIRSIRS